MGFVCDPGLVKVDVQADLWTHTSGLPRRQTRSQDGRRLIGPGRLCPSRPAAAASVPAAPSATAAVRSASAAAAAAAGRLPWCPAVVRQLCSTGPGARRSRRSAELHVRHPHQSWLRLSRAHPRMYWLIHSPIARVIIARVPLEVMPLPLGASRARMAAGEMAGSKRLLTLRCLSSSHPYLQPAASEEQQSVCAGRQDALWTATPGPAVRSAAPAAVWSAPAIRPAAAIRPATAVRRPPAAAVQRPSGAAPTRARRGRCLALAGGCAVNPRSCRQGSAH